MIVLDTNVISELMRGTPNKNVIEWFGNQPLADLYLTTIVVAELFYGIQVLHDGKRKDALHLKLTQLVELFNGRILSFDVATAMSYAELMANARKRGLAIQKEDGYIASVAKTHDMQIATRDVSPFQSAGIDVINPWHA